MFKRTKVSAGVLLAIGSALALPTLPAFAQDARVEITGSRIKRADAEGSLPVTVVTREQLEASGSVTVAEFIRSSTFASFGNFRPQSGSSAQSFSEVNLRGLGSRRTLVLVDGRRVAKAPTVGDAVDMNSIPMAAVERIEILTDGASAIYGSDAIGGVVNIILRKDFQGAHIKYGETTTSVKGGDRKEASAIFGVSSEKGRMIAGVSVTSRDIIFQRDYPWGGARGASSFSNNYFNAVAQPDGSFLPGSFISAVPGGCTNPNFYTAGGRCRYDFTFAAADEAQTQNKSVFARGEVNIGNSWSSYLSASVTRSTSFGRYAPVPGYVLIQPTSPANLIGATTPIYLAHRFAAGGNRDNWTDNNLYDIGVGFRGTAGQFDIDFGARRTVSQFYSLGRGYVVSSLAERAFNNGTYNIVNPAGTPASVIQGFTTNTGRDGLWGQTEYYANATTELWQMGGGKAGMYVGIEHRTEQYQDLYDSLSEGGVVLGSSGASAGGSRKVASLSGELLLPLMKGLDATIAARYESYSDYGNDFSPKVSLRFQPRPNITLRASAGKGFSAPSLPVLTQKPAFSADSVVDRRHCLADGNSVAFCDAIPAPSFQINGLVISNPSLDSEKSTQYSFGGVVDVTPNVSVGATFWNTKIDGVLANITAQTIVNRNNGTDTRPIPAGLSITRDPVTGGILQITRGATNEGVYTYQGVDANVIVQHKWANVGSFRHELTWSHMLKVDQNGTDFGGEFGNPKDRIALTNQFTRGIFGVQWNVNMIGKNGDSGVGFVGAYTTHDLQLSIAPPIKGSKIVLGAVNVFGKLPQLVSDNTRPFNLDLYDGYGRQMYVRAEMKF